MKIGELFIELTTKGNTKELDKTLSKLEKERAENEKKIKYKRDLNKATDEEEKKLIKINKNLDEQITKTKDLIAKKQATKQAIFGAIKGIGAFIASATIMYGVIDRMANSLARANQEFINFHAQTGISFASLNKYASAASAVNFNATPEQMAGTMSRLASNLYDIRMGRGDISPYQELAFVGGKSFNPMGMNVEQLIESVREAIKGVDDVQATNIISRMGFNPDDLLMLRMSRQEFEKINSMFLSGKERLAMNKYALELKKMRLEFDLLKDRTLLKIMPLFLKISQWLTSTLAGWLQIGGAIANVANSINSLNLGIKVLLAGLSLLMMSPIVRLITAIYLIIEDIAFGLMGFDSITKMIMDFFKSLATFNDDKYFDDIKKGMEGLGVSFENFANKIKKDVNVWDLVKNVFKNWKDAIKTSMEANALQVGNSIIAEPKKSELPNGEKIGMANNTANNITINTTQNPSKVIPDVMDYLGYANYEGGYV